MKKGLIIAGVLGAIGIGVGLYIYNKQNKVAESDFNALVSLSKNKGQDVFEGTDAQLKTIKAKYLKNFNRKTHNELMAILQKGEKDLTASDKSKLTALLSKLK
jgi:hypothetical protein